MSLKKQYRPWENYDQFSLQVRTYGAQEAVKRAQKIVERNSEFSQKIEEKYQTNGSEQFLEKESSTLLKIFKNFINTLKDRIV